MYFYFLYLHLYLVLIRFFVIIAIFKADIKNLTKHFSLPDDVISGDFSCSKYFIKPLKLKIMIIWLLELLFS